MILRLVRLVFGFLFLWLYAGILAAAALWERVSGSRAGKGGW